MKERTLTTRVTLVKYNLYVNTLTGFSSCSSLNISIFFSRHAILDMDCFVNFRNILEALWQRTNGGTHRIYLQVRL